MSNEEYFDETEMREALCEIGRRVWKREYVAANDGNFSVRLSKERVLCTPTLVSKGFMKPSDLPIITLDGKQLSGRLPMTSEIKVHLEIMRRRPDVKAVVHVHPPNATAFAVAQQPLPKCILPEIEVFLGEIPIAPYATPGTQDFADALLPFMEHHCAFLLANHGALTCGKDPYECYYRMETIEQYCRILILARSIGNWNQIKEDKVADLLKIREKLGMSDRRLDQKDPLCGCGVPGERITGPQSCDNQGQSGELESIINEITERVAKRLGAVS